MLLDLKALFKKYSLSCSGVLHVGAHVGQEFALYNELGLLKQVWVEANENLMPKLSDNIRPDGVNRFVYNVAAGNKVEDVVLYVASNEGQSSSVLVPALHLEKHPEVSFSTGAFVTNMVRLEDFLPDYVMEDVDFLNVDVQGYELEVLKGLGDGVKKMNAVCLEYNLAELYEGCARLNQLDKYLGDRGFVRVETQYADGEVLWGDALYIKAWWIWNA